VPTPFTNKPLRALDWIYRFVGGMTGPKTVELSTSLQLVHDVSRLAQIGSGVGSFNGYFMRGGTDAHVAAGAILTSFDPYGLADTLGLERSGVGVWLCDVSAQMNDNVARFNNAAVSFAYPGVNDFFSSTVPRQVLLANFEDAALEVQVNVPLAGPIAAGNQAPLILARLPMFLPDGGTIHQTTAQTGAGDIDIIVNCLLWMGAKGALPPNAA